MKKFNKILSLGLSLAMCASMVAPAFAVTYSIDVGSVYVENDDQGVYSYQGEKTDEGISRDTDIVITGESDENTIVVGEGVTETTITLKDVDISSTNKAAMSIGANSDVTVELDGENTLQGGTSHAGLELNNNDDNGKAMKGQAGGSVTIQDKNADGGSLTATGGSDGAGIGSGKVGYGANSNVGDITIDGADVTAIGGNNGAGIGSGSAGYGANSSVGDIIITDSNVTATGGNNGAGIGSGSSGTVGGITITDSDVTATGGSSGAGIGSGSRGTAGDITINGGDVTATGDGAGIGTGMYGTAGDITIEDADVTATGGNYGAGIGGGSYGTAGDITITDSSVAATGGNSSAGIGSSFSSSSEVGDITINGGDVTATGGSFGAGIGAGSGSTAGNITIGDVDVTATGGYNGAGIGTGFNGTVEDITVTNSDVTATGGSGAAGIGSSNSNKTIGDIEIKGGDIVAKGGSNAAAIGSHNAKLRGTITLEELNSLIAWGGGSGAGYYAIGKDAIVDQEILNGNFGGSTVINNAKQVTIHIVDANGDDVIAPITMEPAAGYTWRNFATILPEAGKYYVYVTSDVDPEGSFVSQIAGLGNIAYNVPEEAMLTASLSKCGDYFVSYKFASNDPEMALPEGLPELSKEAVRQKLTMDAFLNGAPGASESYEDIKVEGGTWSFVGWERPSLLNEAGNLWTNNMAVTVTGIWTFTADEPEPVAPVTPATPVDPGDDDLGDVTVEDTAIPLAAGPVTRAEFIDYLWRHEGQPASDGVCSFTDVPADHEYVLALAWAEQNGVAAAYEDGSFEPDELVTVAAVREFLGNFAQTFGMTMPQLTALTGDDGEAVIDCAEVLAEFFGE